MKSYFLLAFYILVNLTYGQDYFSEFWQYCESGDTLNQITTLRKWEKKSPNDPELFTSYFNYHFSKSRQEIVTLTTEKPQGKSLTITDSTHQTKGFLGSQIHYNETEFQKGIDKINQGLRLYPDRLDMRFGKIYSYGQKLDWENFTKTIKEAVAYSSKNENDWTWTHNKPYGEGEEGFLRSLQDYQLQLYNTGNDDLLSNMREIANEILKHYPDHVVSLSNISITYMLTEKYDEALIPLMKAEQLDPTDYIVLSNIAQAYKLKGDKDNAIAYYKKTMKYGDERAIDYSKQQIEELSN